MILMLYNELYVICASMIYVYFTYFHDFSFLPSLFFPCGLSRDNGGVLRSGPQAQVHHGQIRTRCAVGDTKRNFKEKN